MTEDIGLTTVVSRNMISNYECINFQISTINRARNYGGSAEKYASPRIERIKCTVTVMLARLIADNMDQEA